MESSDRNLLVEFPGVGAFDAAVVDRLRRMFQVRGPNTVSNTDPDTGSNTDPHSSQALENIASGS